MAVSYTPFANLGKPENGSDRNTWGTVLNNTIDQIDSTFSSQHDDINARLNLDGSVPMQGSIKFVNDDCGIELCGGTRLIDDIYPTTGVKTCYLDVTNNHLVIRTADGTSAMLDVSLDAITYKGEKLLQPSDAGTFFLPLEGGTLTKQLTVPILNVDKVGHDDGLWVDYVAANGNAVQQFAPLLAYAGDRQNFTHNWVVPNADNSGPLDGMTLQAGGNLVIAGEFTKDSDVVLKNDIRTFENAVALLSKIRPVSYVYKSSGAYSLGVIAQELESIPELSHAVQTGPKGTKTVAYMQLIAPMVAAINELAKRVAELEALAHG